MNSAISYDHILENIRKYAPNFKPKLGMVLGSGLGSFADRLADTIPIPYGEIPGFKRCSVSGHSGILHLGYLNGLPIACLQGRPHFYEGATPEQIQAPIRTLKLLGAEILLATNAAGSLRTEVGPGSVVLVTDHINLQSIHALLGPNDEQFGPRFVSMDNAYDVELQNRFHKIAQNLEIPLPVGVYLATLGPTFETHAEIRAFKILGADVVGMSTVPEVIVARHCGLRVAVLSAVSNLAAGLSVEPLSHELTLRGAQLAQDKLFKLAQGFVEDLANHG